MYSVFNIGITLYYFILEIDNGRIIMKKIFSKCYTEYSIKLSSKYSILVILFWEVSNKMSTFKLVKKVLQKVFWH